MVRQDVMNDHNHIVNTVNVSQRRHQQLVLSVQFVLPLAAALFAHHLGLMQQFQLCVQSCNSDLLPCCTFISDKTI